MGTGCTKPSGLEPPVFIDLYTLHAALVTDCKTKRSLSTLLVYTQFNNRQTHYI